MIETALKVEIAEGTARCYPPDDQALASWAIGRPVDQLLDLMPRIFNLCRSAQSLALHLVFGRQATSEMYAALSREMAADHRFKLLFHFPKLLGVAPNSVTLENTVERCCDQLDQIAPRLMALRFDRALFDGLMPMRACPARPVFGFAEMLEARVSEFRQLLAEPNIGAMINMEQGKDIVTVPASRGSYQIRARAVEGLVTLFERRTPTDLMLAPKGLIGALLAALPNPGPRELELAFGLIDPCFPVRIEETYLHA